MLKKIFKTILVLSLCVGLTLPTNAAVSVSDGSAFVTKAEFAADLNNLSNRMAQLENSLDAKIDSLVSSYLTRNGIWNGARQELVFSSWSTTAKAMNTILSKQWGFNYSILQNKSVVNDVGADYRLVIDACSKTGLLVYLNYANGGGSGGYGGNDGTLDGYAGHSKYTGKISVYNITQNVEVGNVVYGVVTESVSPDSWKKGRLNTSHMAGTYTIMGFVNKGDAIGWDIRMQGNNSAGNWPNKPNNNAAYESGTMEAFIY